MLSRSVALGTILLFSSSVPSWPQPRTQPVVIELTGMR